MALNLEERIGREQAAQRELLHEDNPAKDKIIRCGMHVVRVCSVHLNHHAATASPGLCGELLSSMVADCFHYQVDSIGGDGNASTYRFGGSNQKSSSNEQSLFGIEVETPLCHAKETILQSVPN